MARDIKLPQLGQTMEEGTIVNILVSDGDKVEKGDVIFEVETDKATLEVESPAEGYVKKVLVKDGETIPVNTPMLIVGEKHEEIDQAYIDSLAGGENVGKIEPQKTAEPEATLAQPSGDADPSLKTVKLPQLGQTMEEGTVVNILVSPGDKIAKGDVVFEIETDKATLEMESPAEGFVKRVLVDDGETIPVNAPMLIVGAEDAVVSGEYVAAQTGDQAVAETEQTQQGPAERTSGPVKTPEGIRVVRLPQLGQTMEEGTVVNILIGSGDKVEKGDVIFEIETDKATLEMESPAEGIVKMVLVEDGETVPVNDPLLIVGEDGAEVSQAFVDSLRAGPGEQAVQAESKPAPEAKTQAPTQAAGPAKGGKVFASPRAKTIAQQQGVDISTVSPKPGAPRIVAADVLAAVQSGGAQSPAVLGERIPVNRLQKITGEKMLQSKRDIPCFYLTTQVDMTELVKLRSKANESASVKISFNDYIIRAVAKSLRHYPVMTGQLAGDFIQLAERIHVGLAIAVEDGLISPVIKDADQKDVAQIAEYSKSLIQRTKANQVTLDDLEGGCITISNLGGFGIHSFIPVVVPGQCSILGVGSIEDTCVPSGGNILVRKIMSLTLSVDHKVANGAEAAQFLDFIKKMLEHPAELDQ
ncbi:Dihydrolipoyllysine-residue acetyltransferase component of pyruvate dehydrogenase complex [Anaerohalosphaera lusitana]|uniref:Dihydrolipoamide acetyltransferase component of pyruvate dehydrogenase complex n=1 Tax=Anaerohalosphaera lusitana TaxID=1936003 RepID=A0A1U9NMS6_9BACT|nr:2-oxo acid dehydrogenase subunit E2 [Anaerohalosphaera lusitana]AQT69252.1 Dihydrolipoyllysine-residue acetyltransferase component of pyruvate dehydrogenase complex [Anaerohalosphaera lusitana]